MTSQFFLLHFDQGERYRSLKKFAKNDDKLLIHGYFDKTI